MGCVPYSLCSGPREAARAWLWPPFTPGTGLWAALLTRGLFSRALVRPHRHLLLTPVAVSEQQERTAWPRFLRYAHVIDPASVCTREGQGRQSSCLTGGKLSSPHAAAHAWHPPAALPCLRLDAALRLAFVGDLLCPLVGAALGLTPVPGLCRSPCSSAAQTSVSVHSTRQACEMALCQAHSPKF